MRYDLLIVERSMLDLLSAFQSNIEKWEVIEDLVAAGAVFSKPGFHELDSDDLSDSGDSDYSDESDESSHSFRLCDSFDSLPLIARPYESEAALEYAECKFIPSCCTAHLTDSQRSRMWQTKSGHYIQVRGRLVSLLGNASTHRE